uniref:Uncharacterized protein n=1 Tax=Nelumbo nucifera TaxID=4432 RepID=A0A822ZCA5_NELNU|nr:TPA_asm: hypothetical protein HUJ06_000766 [Nelumbo nucifera]DAD42537.1 TPA_asm: hypothetical protein HUJ06_000767 [Nelumbo nucifera]
MLGDFASTTQNALDYLNGLIQHVKGSGSNSEKTQLAQ